MTVELIEYEPGKWRIKRAELVPARSHLPVPYVISDQMDPVEQVDGRFYRQNGHFGLSARRTG